MIAAENNEIGTVGVAFGASITGVEFIGLTSDAAIVQSMAQQQNFDVVNHSWGFVAPFADSQVSSNAAWSSFFASFPDAVQNGRGGLGTVIVHSAGNDRTNQFNSGLARDTNNSNFTSSRFLVHGRRHRRQRLGVELQHSWRSTPGRGTFEQGCVA